MRIAVNTRFLLNDYLEGYGYFLHETLRRICIQNPQDEFYFLFDRPFDPAFIYSSNVTPVVTGPAARHPLLWKFWYDVKVPSVLRRIKADVFLSADGSCSLTTRVPQCIVIHDLSFLHFPGFMKKSHVSYYKKYTPRFLKKTQSIATVSGFSKNDLVRQYGTESGKINVVYSAAKEIFKPVADEVKQATKQKYTGGSEYFICVGAIHPRKNLINLLKAYSLFKKRQQSNYKLVIAGRLAWKYESFMRDLASYKYRNDVVVPGYLHEEELVSLLGSSYALIYPSWFEGFGVPVLEAMQCRVPVITSVNSSMQEIAGEAALYASPSDVQEIGEQMMRLYKDEDLRSRLINLGEERAAAFSWARTAGLLWESLMKAKG